MALPHKLTLALRRSGEGMDRRPSLRTTIRTRVFGSSDCPITDERVVGDWREIRRGQAQMLPRAPRCAAPLRLTEDGASFVLEAASDWPTRERFADGVARSCPSVWWDTGDGRKRLLTDRRAKRARAFRRHRRAVTGRIVRAGQSRGCRDCCRRTSSTPRMAHAPCTAIDAYAGAGATAVALACAGVGVTAIELDAGSGVVRPRRTCPPGSRASRHGRGRNRGALPADVVILNPPRAGVDAACHRASRERSPRPRAIVYVSCDPATLARDVRRLPAYPRRQRPAVRHVSADRARRNGLRARAGGGVKYVVEVNGATRRRRARRRRRPRGRCARAARTSPSCRARRFALVTIGDAVHRVVVRRGDVARSLHVLDRRLPLRCRGARRAHARDPRPDRGDMPRRQVRLRSLRRCRA